MYADGLNDAESAPTCLHGNIQMQVFKIDINTFTNAYERVM